MDKPWSISLVFFLFLFGCYGVEESGPVKESGPERNPGIVWGESVDGIRIGLRLSGHPLLAVESMERYSVPVSIYIQNLSCPLPGETEGTVRVSIGSWQIGDINPGTAGYQGYEGEPPVDEYPLRRKLLDGRVHFLEGYFIPASSIYPQDYLSGTLSMTLYHVRPEGRYTGDKWRGTLRTGPARVAYAYPDENESGITE
jgi:hypothetical protein